MSMCYWMIEGIGLCASSLEPHLSKEKVVRFLHKQLPNNEKIAELVRTGNFDGLDLEGLTGASETYWLTVMIRTLSHSVMTETGMSISITLPLCRGTERRTSRTVQKRFIAGSSRRFSVLPTCRRRRSRR